MRLHRLAKFRLALLFLLSLWSVQASLHIHEVNEVHDNSCELAFVLSNGEETLTVAAYSLITPDTLQWEQPLAAQAIRIQIPLSKKQRAPPAVNS